MLSLRAKCVKAASAKGGREPPSARGLLQKARAFQHSEAFALTGSCAQCRASNRASDTVGDAPSALLRQFKTLGQLLLAITVANLTLIGEEWTPVKPINT